ncbi:transcriptional repressor [bacterium]|nr:transcriptional repressor [bacterium]
MRNDEARLNHMLLTLKERGQRITPQRLAILRVLAPSEGRPSVEEIYNVVVKDFPTTSLATVYKTITLLKELGEVLELEFSQGSNRYDGSKPFPHPHVVCTRCKRIVDPDLESLSAMTAEVSEQTGFKVVNHRLDFYGLCPECQKEKV